MELIVRGGSRSGLGRSLRASQALGRRHDRPRTALEGLRPARQRPPTGGGDARPRVGGEHAVRPTGVAAQRRVCRLPTGQRADGRCGVSIAERVLPRTCTRTSPGCSAPRRTRCSGLRPVSTPPRSNPDNREIREKRFRFGDRERGELSKRREATAGGWRDESVPAGPLLLADDGARCRHLGTERRPHAQRAANARELRAARRTCGSKRAGRPGRRVCVFAEPARPVLLP